MSPLKLGPLRRLPRWIRRLALALAIVWAVYLAAANVFLNTAWGPRSINRAKRPVTISWQHGYSLFPGHFKVRGFAMDGDQRTARWRLSIARGGGWIDFPRLAGKRLLIRRVHGRGVEMEIDRKPHPAPRPVRTGHPWTIDLRGIRAAEIGHLRLGEAELAGSGRASGRFSYRLRGGPLAIGSAEVELDKAQARWEKASLGDEISLRLDGRLDPMAPREHRGREMLRFVSGRLETSAEAHDLAPLGYFFRAAPWLELAGNGHLEATLELDHGRLMPPTSLTVEAPRLAAGFLDYTARGAARLTGSVAAAGKTPQAELAVDLPRYALLRSGESEPYLEGEGFRMVARAADLDLVTSPFSDLEAKIELPAAEVPDLAVYSAYLPHGSDLAITGGSGRLSGHLELSAADGSGSGELALDSDRVAARYGDLALTGALALQTRLASTDLEARRFAIAGTKLALHDVMVADGRHTEQGWWARIAIDDGEVTWHQPLELDAGITAQMRDTGPLIAVFGEKKRLLRWFDRLLTVQDVEGTTRLVLDGKTITVDELDVTGTDVALRARMRFAGAGQRQGLLYARYKRLAAGIEMLDGEREFKLRKPLQWYESQRFP